MRAYRRGVRVGVQEKENEDQEMRDEQEPNSVSTPIMLAITLNKAGTFTLLVNYSYELPTYYAWRSRSCSVLGNVSYKEPGSGRVLGVLMLSTCVLSIAAPH